MYQDTVTIFNYHSSTEKWYPTVFENADVIISRSSELSTVGVQNADTISVIISTDQDKKSAEKQYFKPREYANCSTPAECYTFNPDKDFMYIGRYSSLSAVSDESYTSGFYHELNKTLDDVYTITSASFYGLIPHFEITGSTSSQLKLYNN